MNSLMTVTARATAAIALSVTLAAPAAARNFFSSGVVFTATNAAAGNAVIAFGRGAKGDLEHIGNFPTGGNGTGSGLGNQGGVVLEPDGRHLFVVNAGSDSISVFRVRHQGLALSDVEPSGGSQPISLTVYGDLVYVLNAGGDGNITGFELSQHGRLSPLPDSTRPLGGAGTGPAQIGFSPDGRLLVVTEKATNTIVTYVVDDDGLAGDPVMTPSAGVTPFGFSFGNRGRLLVSEATGGAPGASTVSSYNLLSDGSLVTITPALPTTQSAACWLVTTRAGRLAYTTNTGSNTVTGLRVARDGSLSLLDDDGSTATTGATPIDAAVTRDGRFLYVLDSGDGALSAFRILFNGALESMDGIGGLPPGTNGLAVK